MNPFKSTSTLMTLLLLLVFGSQANTAEDPTLSKMLMHYLTRGPATALNLKTHDRSSAQLDEKLGEIYGDNQFQPFWIKNGRVSQRGRELFAVLQNSSSHGLDPSTYLVNDIKQLSDKTDAASLVQLDIVLTLGMVRYVADQRGGRLEPRKVDPKLFATARAVEVDWQAVCAQAVSARDMTAFLTRQAPPFLQYRLLRDKLAEYRKIAAAGGWVSIPSGTAVRLGTVDAQVRIIRKRLSVTGELSGNTEKSDVFDQSLVEAVKKFQKRHNLSVDGIVGRQTRSAMNVSVNDRIRQIIINMERYRWLKQLNSRQLVAVNIAGFEMMAGRQDGVDISMPVIVGKTYHQTPVFNDTIEYVVFNPYWNVPPSIARNEILPRLQKDPSYLRNNNMRIFQGWKPGAAELDATTMNWQAVSKSEMSRYHIRQEPGPDNALGSLKIIFPNDFNVYLHDTPDHKLFERETRSLSHGCIRMSRPVEMAAWILGGEKRGWSVEQINTIIATRKRQVVTLDSPIPVYILYRTAFVRPEENVLYFYDDIYGRDKLLIRALQDANH